MSFYGVLNGVFIIFFFSRLTDYFGVKRVYVMGMSASVPCFALFPILNHLARNSIERSGELGVQVWLVVGLQVAMSVLVSMCYGAHVSQRIWTTHGSDSVLCPFQARYSSSSPAPHPIERLWVLRMDSLN